MTTMQQGEILHEIVSTKKQLRKLANRPPRRYHTARHFASVPTSISKGKVRGKMKIGFTIQADIDFGIGVFWVCAGG